MASGWVINELPKWVVFVSWLTSWLACCKEVDLASDRSCLACLVESNVCVCVCVFQGSYILINIILFIYNFVLFQNSDRYYYMRIRTRVSLIAR